MTDTRSEPVSLALTAGNTRAGIKLFHPKGNSMTLEMLAALDAALESLTDHPALRLVTIEGAGPDFSFGANIPEHSPERIGAVLPATHRVIVDLLQLPVVTGAVVRGRCLGGGFELALACDFIFASEDATFGLPEIGLGVFPPAASALLPWRVGGSRAARAIMTGEARGAPEWQADGLVTLVAPVCDLDDAVSAWFTRHLADRSAIALRYAAVAARSGLLAYVQAQLPLLEKLYLAELMHTADAAEGIAAFLEKRVPHWQDR